MSIFRFLLRLIKVILFIPFCLIVFLDLIYRLIIYVAIGKFELPKKDAIDFLLSLEIPNKATKK